MSNLFFKSESVKNSVKSGLNFVSNRVFKAFLLMSMMLLSWNGWAQGYTVIYPEGQTMAEPGNVVTVVFNEDASEFYYNLDEYQGYCDTVSEVLKHDLKLEVLGYEIERYVTYKEGVAPEPKECAPHYVKIGQIEGLSVGDDRFSIKVLIPDTFSSSVFDIYYGTKSDVQVVDVGQRQVNIIIAKWPEKVDEAVKKWTKSFTPKGAVRIDVVTDNLALRSPNNCYCPGDVVTLEVANNSYGDNLIWSYKCGDESGQFTPAKVSENVYQQEIPVTFTEEVIVTCRGNVDGSDVAKIPFNICSPIVTTLGDCANLDEMVSVMIEGTCPTLDYYVADVDGNKVWPTSGTINGSTSYQADFGVGEFEPIYEGQSDKPVGYRPKDFKIYANGKHIETFQIEKCKNWIEECYEYSPAGNGVLTECSIAFDTLDSKVSFVHKSEEGKSGTPTDTVISFYKVDDGDWQSVNNSSRLEPCHTYQIRTNIYIDNINVGYCDSKPFEVQENEKPVIATNAKGNTDFGCNPTIVAPEFSVTDNCDADISSKLQVTAGTILENGCSRSQTWTATATDACNNVAEAVSITYTWTEDKVKPVIATTAENNKDFGCNPTIEAPEFSVTDNCDADITSKLQVTAGTILENGCSRSQTWTAIATDACNNVAEAVSITYTWTEDKVKPVIATTAENNKDFGCNPTIEAPEFSVTDNCDADITSKLQVTAGTILENGCSRSQTWTATATDACNNVAEAVSITYTWTEDKVKPVIATTAENNKDFGCNPTIEAPEFSVTDNCDADITSKLQVTAGTILENGCSRSQTWTATATDACNNVAEAVSITYTWTEDKVKPVIATTAENNKDFGCNPTIEAPEFSVTDNCDADITSKLQVTAGTILENGCSRSQTWTATATDACNNVAEAVSITYTWTEDKVKPVITTTAENNKDFGCNPTIVAPEFTVSDNCDKSVKVIVTPSEVVKNDCQRSQTWTATATDVCGNEAESVSITYTWTEDNVKPVITTTAENNKDFGCNPTIVAPEFTVSDNCDKSVKVIVTPSEVVKNDCQRSQTWTATATDACNNVAEAVSITYTWTEDKVKPVIATTAENNKDFGCNPTIEAPEFSVTDNCDADITSKLQVTAGTILENGCSRSQTWTATATDACNNVAEAVSITYTWTEDKVKPVIATTAENNKDFGCNPTIEAPEFSVTDNCDADITSKLQVTAGTILENGCSRSQTWTATATDACNNVAEAVSITYTWTEDKVKPVITTTAENNKDFGCNPTIVAPEFTVSDNCDKSVKVIVTPSEVVKNDCQRSQTWTATATDVCGNEAESVSITYTWTEDNVKPVITTTAENNKDFGCNPTIVAPEFTVSDNCDKSVKVIVTPSEVVKNDCQRSQTWTATATDACNNVAEAVSITYTWTEDKVKPVIATTAENNKDFGCNPTIEAPEFSVTDNCDADITSKLQVTAGTILENGCSRSQTWTATATDACNNVAEAVSITYTWTEDKVKPVIATTAENNKDFGCNPTIEAPEFSVTDNCDADITSKLQVTAGTILENGCSRSQTWTATVKDGCGNEAAPVSITYTWTEDKVKPVIATTAENNKDFGCNPTIEAPEFSVTDNCDADITSKLQVTAGTILENGCSRSQTWTAIATDACNNVAEAVSITYTWTEDKVKPVITTTAENNKDFGCNPEIVAPEFTVSDNCGEALEATVTTIGVEGDGCTKSQTWTATVKDGCGNEAVPVSITYTWTEDKVKPVITTTAENNKDFGCNPTIEAPEFSVTDNCDADITSKLQVTAGTILENGCSRSQTWTATATDACNNVAEAVSITYTWTEDKVKPVIATTAENNKDFGCNPTIEAPEFSVTDNCDADITSKLQVTAGTILENGCSRSQTWTATATDACNNVAEAVSITYTWTEDKVKPVIATTAENNKDFGCNPTIEAPEFSVTDNCDADITSKLQVTAGTILENGCSRSQTWTATATDACNNVAEAVSITYTWTEDKVKPVIATTAENNKDFGCNPTIEAPEFSVTDNCDADITSKLQVTAGTILENGCSRSQTWTATATDACNNVAEAVSITYTWTEDKVKPVIATTAENNKDFGCNPTIEAPEFSVTDNCDADITSKLQVTAGTILENGCSRSQTWTATATDACNNVAEAVSITYTWTEDKVKPVIATTAENNKDFGCNPTIEAPEFSVTDNCDADITSKLQVTAGTILENGCSRSQTWTATATDACNNVAEAVSITYTWTEDKVKPVIATTAENNKDFGCNPTIEAPEFSVTDNCDADITSKLQVTAGTILENGCSRSQTWTATATDACNNVAEAVSITYTWTEDKVKPVIATTAENNKDFGCNPTIEAPEFSVTDNCDADITSKLQVTAGTILENGCSRSQTWTATATDACNNVAEAVSITYTWTEDKVKPVITTTAENNKDFGCNPTIVAPEFTVSDNCDKSVKVIVTPSEVVKNDCQRSQTWTATATDVCGNEAESVSITYTWTEDNVKPVITTTAENNKDFGCNPTIVAPEFTVSDNCDKSVKVIVTPSEVVKNDCQRSQTWTATATDACNNVAEAVSITYTWTEDKVKPVIATTAENNKDFGCNPTIEAPEFSVTDNCDADITSKLQVTAGTILENGCSRSQTWTATATDACNNVAEAVSITYTWTEDKVKPVIATTAENNKDFGCNPTIEAPEFSVTDNCDADITSKLQVTAGTILENGCSRSQTWTATATDACNNVAEAVSITYTWTEDKVKPVITTTAENNKDFGCNPTIVAPEFTVSDNCDKSVKVIVTPSEVVKNDCQRSQTWTATATDVCGNEAESVSITYTWTEDNVKPVITTTAENNKDFGCNPTIVAPEFTVSDNCDKSVKVIVTPSEVVKNDCQRSQTWTATATDACNNVAEAVSITYTWTEDKVKPVIATTAENNKDFGCNPTIEAPEFSVTDNCDADITSKLQVTAGTILENGCSRSQTWTATATDACNNVAEAVSITYTWTEDKVKPVIATTAENNKDFGCNPTIEAPEFSVTDNCDADITSKLQVTAGTILENGCSRSQTWTATVKDGCGNEAAPVSITYTWTEDKVKPVITTTAENNKDFGCNPEIVAPEFTVSDNCGEALEATVTTIGVEGDGCTKSQTWTATVKDGCGNEANPVVITYTWVVDTEVPIITNLTKEVAANVSACEFSIPNLEEIVRAKASDNCSEDLIITQTPEVGKVITTSTNATIEVKDNCGNTSVVEMLVTVSSPLQLSILSSESYCKGEADGVIEAQIEGGVAPYVLTVNGEIVDVTIGELGEFVVTGLSDNSYELVVKDANGCMSSATTVVKELENTIEVTAKSDSKIYDGEPLTFDSEDYVVKGDLLEGDEIVVTVEPTSIKNVGSIETSIADVKILRGDLDVTCYYGVEMVHGTLTILKPSKVQVTITEHGVVKTYNNEEYVVTGYDFATSNDLYTLSDFKFHGDSVVSGTNVGNYPMDLTAEDFENINENFEVEFKIVNDSLVINSLDVLVEITGNSSTEVYNGNQHTLSGYTWRANSNLYTEEDFEFVGDSIATGTIAGKYAMGLLAGEFININKNFNVNFSVVEDGELIISQLDVIVTITGATKETYYTGSSQNVTGYTWSSNTPTYTESDFTFVGNSLAYGINVGTYPMNLSADQFTNINKNFGKVTFVIEDGSITISPMIEEVIVRISGHHEEVLYDGSEHTLTGYSLFTNHNLLTQDDIEFSGEKMTKAVNAGTYHLGLSEDQFKNTNKNFANVKFEVSDGTLIINKRHVLLESESKTQVYNGELFTHKVVNELNDGFAEGEGATYEFYAELLYAGEETNEFSYTLNEGTLAENYIIEEKYGILTLTPIRKVIDIIANSAEKYHDRKPLSDQGYTYTEGVLIEGDTLIVEIEGIITEVGVTKNEIVSYRVMRGDIDVTDNYTFGTIKNGSLRVLHANHPTVVFVRDGKIIVHEAFEFVYVYDVLSRRVYLDGEAGVFIEEYGELDVPCTGAYVVIIGEESYKVVVHKK